jgi:hypothetical protein
MHPARTILPFLALASALRADESLADARGAQDLLGTGGWSEVIRIENRSFPSPYPRTVYALVFELNDALWFYTDTDGTQSLSRFLGRLKADEADVGPLLRFIEPGFEHWAPVPSLSTQVPLHRRIPHGCFLECIALLRERMSAGMSTHDARLLSYYVRIAGQTYGHTVLQYRSPEGIRVIDPDWPHRIILIRAVRGYDPQSIAAHLRNDIDRTYAVPLDQLEKSAATTAPSTPLLARLGR